MKKIRCIKTIPHLVEEGEEGTAEYEDHLRIVPCFFSWFCSEMDWTYERIKGILKLSFNKVFFESDIFAQLGQYDIKDYFVII